MAVMGTTGDATGVVVTGATGFVGGHVVAELRSRGLRVTATGYPTTGPDTGADLPGVDRVDGDLADMEFVDELFDRARPGAVLHLAAPTRPTDAVDGFGGFGAAVTGTASVVAGMQCHAPGARLVVVSSSAVYGTPATLPIDEDTPLRPVTDYGVAKAAQELVGLRTRWAGEMDVGVVRPFNLVGPGMPPHLLLGSVVDQLTKAAPGTPSTVETGDLRTRRDYVDVRDLASALADLLEVDDLPAAVNVASGRSWSGEEVVARAIELSGREVELRQAGPRQGGGDVLEQIGDAGLLRRATGWQPAFEMDQSLVDMLTAMGARTGRGSQ